MFITGGRGRMGSTLIPQLQQAGWTITAPSSQDLDITDETSVAKALEAAQADVVLHLAAYTNVAQAEQDRTRCWQVNVIGTRNIARHTAGRLVHFSTDYVFDGERGQYQETDTPNPSNYYSLTKTVAEEAAHQATRALLVRTSFKDSVWPYPMAFEDQFTSADFTDVIAAEIFVLLQHLEHIPAQTGVLHVATARKSIFELARRRNPDVQPGSRLKAKVHIPPDVSLDTSKWQGIKANLGTPGNA